MFGPIIHAHPEVWNTFLEDVKTLGISKTIFISYAWYDDAAKNIALRCWLETLSSDLEKAGLTVFLDLSDASSEMDPAVMRESIRQKINLSDAALVIGAPAYLKAVQTEETRTAFESTTLLAQHRNHPTTFLLLPILCEGLFFEALPRTLANFLVRNCQDTESYVKQMIGLSMPPGLLPELLSLHLGSSVELLSRYKVFFERHQVHTLTNLAPKNPNFQDPAGSLVPLARGFITRDADAIPPPQIINGLGGVGKSELALAYAYEHKQDYEFVYWISSRTLEQLENSLSVLAKQLEIKFEENYSDDESGDDESSDESDDESEADSEDQVQVAEGYKKEKCQASWIEALYEKLSKIKSWLLIFDDVENDSMISVYLPQVRTSSHHVLITSRSSYWRYSFRQFRLNPLSKDQGLAFLAACLNERDLSQGETLVDALEGLPSALAQAAAYLAVRKETSIAEYCLLLQSKDLLRFLPTEKEDDDEDEKSCCPKTVATTCLISFQSLMQESPGGLLFLIALAYLASDDIPLGLFSKLMSDKDSLQEAVIVLLRYSLISWAAQAKQIKMHLFVQIMVQEALSKGYFRQNPVTGQPYQVQFILNALKMGMEHYYTGAESGEFRKTDFISVSNLLAHLKALIDHYDQQAAGAAESRKRRRFNQSDAESLVPKALSSIESAQVERFYLLEVLAEVYSLLGKMQQQKSLLEEVLAFKEHYYGKDDKRLSRILIDLSDALSTLKSKDLVRQRIALLNRVLAIERAADSAVQNKVIIGEVLHDLGLCWAKLSDSAQSLRYFHETIGVRRQDSSVIHREMAMPLENLSQTYMDASNFEKATLLLRWALLIKRVYYGGYHPEVILTLLKLSDALIKLGQLERSQKVLKLALFVGRKYYGPKHPKCLVMLIHLGFVCSDLEDYGAQIVLFEEARSIVELNYPEKYDGRKLTVLYNLGVMYQELDHPFQARVFLQQAVEIQKATDGENYSEIGRILLFLSLACAQLNDSPKEIECLEELIDLQRKHQVLADRLHTCLCALADAYFSVGDIEKHKEVLEAAVVAARGAHSDDGDRHIYLPMMLFKLANACTILNLEAEATQARREGVEKVSIRFANDPDKAREINRKLLELAGNHCRVSEMQQAIFSFDAGGQDLFTQVMEDSQRLAAIEAEAVDEDAVIALEELPEDEVPQCLGSPSP
jgi:hypothetical protein